MVTEIKRFVSYIYMYNNGIKESNVGFAKVDSRNGQCKIAVNIKGVVQSNGKCEKVYLFYRRQEDILGIYIGSFQIVNGIGEFHEQFETQNIRGTNLALDEMNGIFVREEDKNERIFASGWDDYAIVVNRFYLHNSEGAVSEEEDGLLRVSEVLEQKKEPIIFFDRNWKEEVEAAEQAEEIEQVDEEMLCSNDLDGKERNEKDSDIGESDEERQNENSEDLSGKEPNIERLGGEDFNKRESDRKGLGQENSNDFNGEDLEQEKFGTEELDGRELNGEAEEQKKKQEDFERGVKRGQKMDIMQKKGEEQEQRTEFMQQAEGIETVVVETVNGEREVTNIHSKRGEVEKQKAEDTRENGLLWETPAPSMWKEISWEECQEKERQLREQVQKCMNQNREQWEETQSEQMSQDKMQQNTMQGMDMVGWIDPVQSEEWAGSAAETRKKGKVELKSQMSENVLKAEETIWDKLCHQFPKIRAFVDEPECLCLKIDLRDLRMLPQENWVLGSNSFLLHGYYNFRYLILTRENGEFVLGIPGIYHPNEKMMASMFGFGGFKPVKVCDKMLGQFGYWYKKVTL